MSTNWLSCKGSCIGSDPVQDTVKIDPNLLMMGEHGDKENTRPMSLDTGKNADLEREREAMEQKLVEERRKQADEVAKRFKEKLEQEAAAKAVEEERRRQEQKAAAEKAKQEIEEQKRVRRAAEEEAAAAEAREAAAVAAKEKLRQDQEAQQAAEERARQAAAAEAAETAAAQAEVSAWCKANGFSDMNTQKKTLRGATKFPLHTAVKQQDSEMVRMLLKCGANKDATNSKKQTSLDLAVKMSNGLPDMKAQKIIALLRSGNHPLD